MAKGAYEEHLAAIFHPQAKDPTGATVTLAHLDDLLNGHSADWPVAKILTKIYNVPDN